jgi:hypothetical protein
MGRNHFSIEMQPNDPCISLYKCANTTVLRKALFALITLSFIAPALAQDDTFFGSDLVKETDTTTSTNAADELLSGQPLTIGGNVAFSAEASLASSNDYQFSVGLTELSSTLFLDTRPNRDFRAFAKGNLSYTTTSGLSFDLKELFADVAIGDTVFLRAGKQTINWGVGYFFSPANLVNLQRIDPENPEAELSGPVSLKAQLPIGSSNATTYLIMDDLTDSISTSLAVRYEFLVSDYEITAGAILEDNGHWALATTASGNLQGMSLFAEAVLEGNSNKVFVIRDNRAALGLSTSTSDSLFFSATLGTRYSYTSEDDLYTLSASGQYFFNGKGYSDSSIFTDNPAAIAGLLASKALTFSDLQERGQHYLALSISSPDIAKTDITPSVFWISNLSDGSGLVSSSLRYSGIDYFTPTLNYRFGYGTNGAEYSQNGESHTISLGFDIKGEF